MCSPTFLGRVGVEVGVGVGGLCALYCYVFGCFNLRESTYNYALFVVVVFAPYVYSFIHSFINAVP